MKIVLFLNLALVCAVASAQGTLNRTVLPLGFESQNGALHDDNFQYPSERQQWYRGSYLAQSWSSPVQISEIAFRVNEEALFGRGIDTIIPRIEIAFSTTSREAASLYERWVNNIGVDARTVYSADSVRIVSPGGAGPNSFGMRFSFAQPFIYDPAAGNLIVRINTEGAGEFPGGNFIDAQAGFGPLSETPVAQAPRANFPFPEARALIIEFGWSAIPEPTIPSLLIIGFLFTLIPWRARR